MLSFKKNLATLLIVGASAAAGAQTVVWDQGPLTGNSGGSWVNQTDNQNFADHVMFSSNTVVGGLNYFTGFDLSAQTGATDFHIKILADNAGNPGAYIAQWDQGFSSSQVNVVPGVNQYSFNFAPIVFAAGTTYWVGISGNGFEAAQNSVFAPQDGMMAQFSGQVFSFHTGVGDQMFQLTSAVPEPQTYGMLLAGLAVTGALARRRRQA